MSAPEILIVEDDAIEAMDIKHTLESFGYSVSGSASEGKEAIEKAKILEPDLILMDIVLKDEIDGIEVSEAIKDLEIPVIYLTAHSEESMVKRAKLTQPYAYIIKPFDIAELKYSIEMALYKHEMEMQLKESERKYKKIVETSMEGIWGMDADFKTTFVNSRMAEMLGYQVKEMLVKPVNSFMFKEDLLDHDSHMKSRIEGVSESYERKFRRKDGSKLWTIVSATALKDSKGRFAGSFGMFTDITKRKEIEKELNFTQFAVDRAPESIFWINEDSKFVYVNDKACTSLGYTREELLSMKLPDIDPNFPPTMWKKHWKEIKERKSFSLESNHLRKDGKSFPIEVRVNYLQFGGKEYNCAFVRNIKERKLMEKELKESETNLKRALKIAKMGNWDWSIVNNTLKWSEQLYNIFGVQKDFKLTFESIESMIHPDDREENIEKINQLLNDGVEVDFEMRIIRPDGEIRYIYQDTEVKLDNRGKVVKIFGIIQDITERKKYAEKLEFLNQWLGFAQKAAKSGFWNWNMETDDLTWTKEFYELFGLSESSKASFDTWLEVLHPEDREMAMNRINQSISDHSFLENEYRIILPNGEIRWINALGSTYYNDSGEPQRMSGICIDITSRKKVEDELKTSENYYRTIFENTGTATVIIEEDTTISLANSEFEELSGFSREEIEGKKSWTEFVHEDDMGKMREYHNLRRTDTKKAPRTYEFRFINSQGQIKNIFLEVAVIPGTKKSVASLLNISERKIAEDSLKQSEEKYRLVVETAAEGIVVLDWKGKIIEINQRALEMAGLGKNELLGKNFINILPKFKIDKKRAIFNFKNIILGKSGDEPYWVMTNPNGEEIKFMVHYAALKSGKRIIGISAILEDITSRVEAEEELKESLNEKEFLLKEIHHRVKNNLQIISSLLNLQSSYVKDSADLEIFEESRNRVKSMAMIHEKLYQSEDLARINFKDYIVSLGSELFASYKVEPRIKLNMEVEKVMLDINTAIPCGLILNELLTNAIKHAFPQDMKGKIDIQMAGHDDSFELIISDNGIGFPEDIDFKKTETLGLQIVNNLVRQLDGTIKLDRDNGTEFKIIFKKIIYEM
ncbi:MAG: PAS domain S-box protein [Methanomicrobiales archaeon]